MTFFLDTVSYFAIFDSLWLAIQVITDKVYYKRSSVDIVNDYSQVMPVKRWLTRMSYYVCLSTFAYGLSLLLSVQLAIVIHYILIFVHIPFLWRIWWIHATLVHRLTRNIDRVQDCVYKYIACLIIHKLLMRHVESDVVPIELYENIDDFRLKEFLKNAVTIWLLSYCRSYQHLYIYYKIAKYVFYYNYGYKFENMDSKNAQENIQHIIDNRVWTAVSEPIFVHSIVTLEQRVKGTQNVFSLIKWLIIQWFTLWSILQVSTSLIVMSIVAYALNPKTMLRHVLVAGLVTLVSISVDWHNAVLSGLYLILMILCSMDVKKHIIQYMNFHKSTPPQVRGFVSIPAISEKIISDDDADYILLDTF